MWGKLLTKIIRATRPTNELQGNGPQDAASLHPSCPIQQPPLARHSAGLREFANFLAEEGPMRVLDLGAVCQQNVAFITELGHKLYTEDLQRQLQAFPKLPGALNAPEQDSAEAAPALNFLRNFPAGFFGGVLVWDCLQFMPKPMCEGFVEEMHRLTAPGGCLLAVFHSVEKPIAVPAYRFRIRSNTSLELHRIGTCTPIQCFSSRAIENLFNRFHSVKFFLSPDNLREVLVRR